MVSLPSNPRRFYGGNGKSSASEAMSVASEARAGGVTAPSPDTHQWQRALPEPSVVKYPRAVRLGILVAGAVLSWAAIITLGRLI